MRFYLSSYKLGNEVNHLQRLVPVDNSRIAYISNAFDAVTDTNTRERHEKEDMDSLIDLELEVEHLDLREYFGKTEELRSALESFGTFWVSGGNVFVLRQAMKLSGFDKAITEMKDKDILYGGYSAGVCILASTLKGLHIVDDPNAKPYGEEYETIWTGLGLIGFTIAPHYNSDHPESEDINKEIQYCIEHNIPYKPLRDGEVIIVE